MPKLKTHSGAAKRIKKSSTGKLLRRKAHQNHFLSKKSSARKRAYGQDHGVDKTVETKIKQLLGDK
ncbi:50S ribosomal protein L35 [Candidatus Saccharibacteria bacterium]|jgi:large subunit ribosomal protein L35|nr:50S ribosomal protein L35 [Candidatus Saccharibacteria bacterium]